MKPEQLLWLLVKPFIPGHVERIENVANVGTPDVHFTYGGKSYWIELKVAKKDGQVPLDLLDPSQIVWHVKDYLEGGRVYVLLRDGPKITLYKTAYDSKLRCAYLPIWRGTKPWNWHDFESIMRVL